MLAFLLSLALAQTPVVANTAAETVWVAGEGDAPARRFADGEASAAVKPGESGEVIVRENGWVRLRLGTRYLWVEESRVTSVAPAGAEKPAAGGFDLSKLLEMSGQ
ncbi:MAG: hypothetical protein H6736_16895 [Alphaproteobacteria bacterium]|nr:hypothetical protein [Alphaproteobacteria bacterium]MCB9693491.1 hypothetical protein [Alphaproteobacteria bacterium]